METLNNIEQEIVDLKQKIQKIESNKSWYKNYPFILSLVAFLFTTSISLYTLKKTTLEKKSIKHSSTLSDINKSIEDFKNYEKEYFQQISNINLDPNTKNLLSGIYYSKIDQLTTNIEPKLTKVIINDIDPTILNDCARYLQLLSKTDKAIKLNEIALQKCRDDYTKVTVLRCLGNLYSQPGKTQNRIKSRTNRSKALKLTKSYSGEYATNNSMQSFILWANDEYMNFNDREFANSLLDSAMTYAKRLQNFNPQKNEAIRQIRSSYNYFNDILNISFGTGNWEVFDNKQKVGEASLNLVNNNYLFNLEFIEGNKFQKQISGSGNFSSERVIKIFGTESYLEDVQILSYKKNKNTAVETELLTKGIPQQRIITLELNIIKNKFIKMRVRELGKKPKFYDLKFVQSI
ncbi:hypothetical protein ACFSJW_14920 [Flavobacterium artemisiae]|uniref:Tetratricopeptide repeat-containing protein n=1 Tax=Flavobacterium artemisiae TaxID=2126556 RepID=A0ABW4HH79_9FLAO